MTTGFVKPFFNVWYSMTTKPRDLLCVFDLTEWQALGLSNHLTEITASWQLDGFLPD